MPVKIIDTPVKLIDIRVKLIDSIIRSNGFTIVKDQATGVNMIYRLTDRDFHPSAKAQEIRQLSATQLRSANDQTYAHDLKGSHRSDDIIDQLRSAGDDIIDQLRSAGDDIIDQLRSAGDDIIDQPRSAGDDIIDQPRSAGDDIIDQRKTGLISIKTLAKRSVSRWQKSFIRPLSAA